MYMHPRHVLSAFASLGLLATACSGSSSDQPLDGPGSDAGAGGTAITGGAGGSTGGNAGSTGGSGGNAGGAGGSTGGSGGNTGGNTGGSGGNTGGSGGNTGGSGGNTGGSGGNTGGSGGNTGGSGGNTGGSGGTGGPAGTCNGTPSTCADIGSDQDAQFYGCCDGDTVYWCDDQTGTWELHNQDCATNGQSCAYVADVAGMYCAAEPVDPVDPGDAPGPGPGPDCAGLPPLECSGSASECSAIVPFDPDNGDGYVDYPENGETASNQYRSYLRRDLMMLIKYATAKVACKAAGWNTGNGAPLGLIDMSEANGAIPGTSVGSPGHPAGTHVNGRDIDVAYYQTANMPDNRARPVCEHTVNGQEAYHCVAEPTLLDAWRSAAFIGFLFEHPSLRVIGVDGKVGPHIDASLDYLCQNGWLTSYACSHRKLTYEVTDQGYGWYYFHHHHTHVSFTPPSYPSSTTLSLEPECLIDGCDAKAWRGFLEPYGL